MLCVDGDPSQPDLVTIWIYLDRGQPEDSLNGFCMPKCVEKLFCCTSQAKQRGSKLSAARTWSRTWM